MFNKLLAQTKNIVTNLLGFITLMITMLILGIVGIASCSTLPLHINIAIIGLFLVMLVIILMFTFFKALKNPIKFIFNQNAFVLALKDKFGDSEFETVYSSIEEVNKYTNAPKKIEKPKDKK